MNACINSSIYICIHMYIWIWIYTHMYTCSCIYMYPALSRVNFIESNMKFDIYFFGSRSHLGHPRAPVRRGMPWKQGWLLQCVAAYCRVLQRDAVCCSVRAHQVHRRAPEPHSIAYEYTSHSWVSFDIHWSLLIRIVVSYTRVCTCICISTARSIACKYKRLIHFLEFHVDIRSFHWISCQYEIISLNFMLVWDHFVEFHVSMRSFHWISCRYKIISLNFMSIWDHFTEFHVSMRSFRWILC